MNVRPRRSVLYMPGSNARALEKSRTLAADTLILDLEDAVAPEAKVEARARVCEAVAAGGFGPREVVIRVNAADSAWGADDLEAAVHAMPDAVLIPKVSRPDDIAQADADLDRLGAGAGVKIWVMMETPLAVLNAAEIAAAAAQVSRFDCMVMGTNDLAKETGAGLAQARLAMVPWLMTCVAAATAHGLAIIDGVYNDFRDADGCAAECAQGRLLGMDGKTLIHPGQIEAANRAFAPTEAEVAAADEIIAAFALPENAGRGAISLNGRMIERLHRDVAERTLAMHAAIAAMEGTR